MLTLTLTVILPLVACEQRIPTGPNETRTTAQSAATAAATPAGATDVPSATSSVMRSAPSYRIEGYVNYSSGFKYGPAINATIEVLDDTQRVVARSWSGTRGFYETYAPGNGRYKVRATYNHNGLILRGTSTGVLFTTSNQAAYGQNITVR